VTIVLVSAVVRAHKRRVLSGREGLIGEEGITRSKIHKGRIGKVLVHGETWNATSDEDVKKDEKIRIVRIDRMVLTVRRI
jgi:membrane-bound serine protease (ClpP class)